jgi:hypothetical protein
MLNGHGSQASLQNGGVLWRRGIGLHFKADAALPDARSNSRWDCQAAGTTGDCKLNRIGSTRGIELGLTAQPMPCGQEGIVACENNGNDGTGSRG